MLRAGALIATPDGRCLLEQHDRAIRLAGRGLARRDRPARHGFGLA